MKFQVVRGFFSYDASYMCNPILISSKKAATECMLILKIFNYSNIIYYEM